MNIESTTIELDKYQKHWTHTRPYGHDIVIWSEPNNKLIIKCEWPDKERGRSGRVYDKRR